ncbi:hypothetical protein CVT24_012281, partial [Panaeolus cyanescens]
MHPGNFSPLRKEFLETQRVIYDAAYEIGDAKNAMANIFRRYCKRFPLDLPDDTEPSQDHLDTVDDNEADEESEGEEGEESAEVTTAHKDHAIRIQKTKAKIQRWLNYRYVKSRAPVSKKDAIAQNHPFANLFRLTENAQKKKPVKPTAINVWSRGHSLAIDKETRRRVDDSKGAISLAKGLAGIRSKVKAEWFGKLDDEDKEHYNFIAQEEHKIAINQWELEKQGLAVDTSPQARQKCIDQFNKVVQPLLDALCEATGWKASLIAGGPEPVRNGLLGIKMLHSGSTTGDVKMDWGRAEHERIPERVYPLFADFLRKCYTVKECQNRSLVPDGGGSSTDTGIPPLPRHGVPDRESHPPPNHPLPTHGDSNRPSRGSPSPTSRSPTPPSRLSSPSS